MFRPRLTETTVYDMLKTLLGSSRIQREYKKQRRMYHLNREELAQSAVEEIEKLWSRLDGNQDRIVRMLETYYANHLTNFMTPRVRSNEWDDHVSQQSDLSNTSDIPLDSPKTVSSKGEQENERRQAEDRFLREMEERKASLAFLGAPALAPPPPPEETSVRDDKPREVNKEEKNESNIVEQDTMNPYMKQQTMYRQQQPSMQNGQYNSNNQQQYNTLLQQRQQQDSYTSLGNTSVETKMKRPGVSFQDTPNVPVLPPKAGPPVISQNSDPRLQGTRNLRDQTLSTMMNPVPSPPQIMEQESKERVRIHMDSMERNTETHPMCSSLCMYMERPTDCKIRIQDLLLTVDQSDPYLLVHIPECSHGGYESQHTKQIHAKLVRSDGSDITVLYKAIDPDETMLALNGVEQINFQILRPNGRPLYMQPDTFPIEYDLSSAREFLSRHKLPQDVLSGRTIITVPPGRERDFSQGDRILLWGREVADGVECIIVQVFRGDQRVLIEPMDGSRDFSTLRNCMLRKFQISMTVQIE